VIDFFVIGNPRSGTTLLRLMLNNHPKITVPPECGFAMWLYSKYKDSDFTKKEVKQEYINDVMHSRKFETWDVNRSLIEQIIFSKEHNDYSTIASAFYYAYAEKNKKYPELVGDKNNFYVNEIALIKKVFSTTKFIYIVRDGRDVALSYKKLYNKKIDSEYAPKLENTIDEIALSWNKNNGYIVSEKNDNSILITYENLVVAPEKTLKEICTFLKVDFDSSMLSYYMNTDEPTEFLQWKEKVQEKPDSNYVQLYLKQMNIDDIKKFESIAGDMLTTFGYELYGNG